MAISEPSIVNFDPAGLAEGSASLGGPSGPIAKLFDNRYRRELFSYPRNLASDATRRHVIEFTVREPDPSYNQTGALITELNNAISIARAAANLEQDINNFADIGPTNLGSGTFANQARQVANAAGGTLSQLGSSAKGLVDIISATDVKRKDGTTIRLYIPDTVNVSYNSQYDDTKGLTGMLGRPYFLAQAGASLYDSVAGAPGSITSLETIKDIVNRVGDNPYARQLLANRTGISEDLLLSGVGAALNPQLQVLFQGVGFRSHQFDFTLTPHSKQEAEEIKKIVKAFKFAAAPEIPTNAIFGKGIYFKVPDRFNIKFLYNGQENRNVHRITECVLQNVNVDYAPMGWSTFDDGNPVQTRLTLQFQETEIVDKTRIAEGY
jgi:hypothetical protein